MAGVATYAVYAVLSSKFLAETSPLNVVLVQQVAASCSRSCCSRDP